MMGDSRASQWAPVLYRLAIRCGVIPLTIGVLMFAGWVVTRDFSFILMGLGAMYVLLLVIAIGVLSLLGYGIAMIAAGKTAQPRTWGLLAVAALVLAINFPAAYAMRAAVIHFGMDFRAEVQNESGEDLRDVRLRMGDTAHALEPLSPGERTRARFPVQHRRQVWFTADAESGRVETLVSGYTMREDGLMFITIVTVHPEGEVTVGRREGLLIRVYDAVFGRDSGPDSTPPRSP